MLIVRPVEKKDLSDLLSLAKRAGVGLTTLPKDKKVLAEKIEASLSAFKNKPKLDQKAFYLLVLEDVEKKKIVGTSGIAVGVGIDKPFYTYRLLHITHENREMKKRVDTELLQISNDFVGATEISTLFLAPEYRKSAAGRLLAKARYLLIAAHRDRFSDTIISEIRGWIDDKGKSPFWEGVGRHFFDMDFEQADQINGQGNTQFIMDLMPHHPLYTCMLPASARDVIGRPHDSALPAVRLLEGEGFRYVGAVDIFDAGPTFEVHKELLWSVRKSIETSLGGVVDGVAASQEKMVANASLKAFKVVLGDVVETAGGYWVSSDIATALHVKKGDKIIFTPLHKPKEV